MIEAWTTFHLGNSRIAKADLHGITFAAARIPTRGPETSYVRWVLRAQPDIWDIGHATREQ